MTGYLAPIGAIVGVGALITNVVMKIYDHKARKANMLTAVDELIKTDALTDQVLNAQGHLAYAKLHDMKRDKVKELVRKEALAMMGFTSYEQCYRHICIQYATLLYSKVFTENPAPQDIDMYKDAMRSLGMKMNDRAAVQRGEKAVPSIEAMVTKMMG